MKKSFTLILVVCLASLNLYSQCNPFFSLKEGTEYEMEMFNARDKSNGKIVYKVQQIEKSDNGFNALIHSTMYNKGDKMMHEGEFEMICEDGMMKMDMGRLIPEESLKAIGEDVKPVIEGDYLNIPSNLSVGQELKGGTISMKIENGGNNMMGFSSDVEISNRKVVSKETITTPAGTFDCFKITFDVKSSTKVMGMNMGNTTGSAEYIAEEVGVVKTETYDKKGKLDGYMLLTKFTP